jgi:DNA-directed RNA polymerase subunit M/transcription elongation factor TFIIS
MSLHFCSDCGKIMKVNKQADLLLAVCGSCSTFKELSVGIVTTIKSQAVVERSKDVADEKNSAPAEGKFPHICSACGHDEAYAKDLGAFLGDESNVYLFKCVKCNHTDRQADGCSNL